MIAIRRSAFVAYLVAVVLALVSTLLCGFLLIHVQGLTDSNHKLEQTNQQALSTNRALLETLTKRDAAFARFDALVRRRESAFQTYVLQVQRQVSALGGEPAPFPSELGTPPGEPEPSASPASRRPTGKPTATPTPTASPCQRLPEGVSQSPVPTCLPTAVGPGTLEPKVPLLALLVPVVAGSSLIIWFGRHWGDLAR